MDYQVMMAGRLDSNRFVQEVSTEICSFRFDEESLRVSQQARMSGIQLDQMNVVLYEGHGLQWGERKMDHIRADRGDCFVLSMPLAARVDVTQDGLETRLFPGSFVFLATSRPSQASIRSLCDGGPFRSLHVRIPGPMLRQRLPNIDDLCNREFNVERGAGVVMRNLIESTIAEANYLSSQQASSLGTAMFETICNVAIPAAEIIGGESSARMPSLVRTCLRAKAYIEAYLSDPTLNIERIADHCQVSVRYLHAAFASSPMSVAAFIRERRLQGCRLALQSPSLKSRQIIDIAGDWGFEDPAHFSHMYKARFGKTPRQERQAT